MPRHAPLLLLSAILVAACTRDVVAPQRATTLPDPTPRSDVSLTPPDFLETFDGSPSSPLPFFPQSTWDVARHATYYFGFAAMNAMHGPDCSAPPATHNITTLDQAVFQCYGHMMTAIYTHGYAEAVLTPNRMVDFSGGEQVIGFDVSTLRTAGRDWIDFWVTPYSDNLVNPVNNGTPDLSGAPNRAVQIQLQLVFGPNGAAPQYTYFTGNVYNNFVATPLPQATYTPYASVLTPSATVRTHFELHISQTHVKFGIPAYNLWWVDANIPALGWTSGTFQIAHHSYHPVEESLCPTCLPDTWHWDNVSISKAIPFTILPGTPWRVNIADANHTVTFPQPAPANTYLRFSGLAGSLNVSFDGGATWQPAQVKQPQQPVSRALFWSYWHPVPVGATSVTFSGTSYYGNGWEVRDVALWSTATPTIVAGTPTPPGAPQSVTAVGGAGQATVSWAAPASNGGSPITGYTVTSSPGNITVPVSGSALSAVVPGLTNGVSYTFTVVATNSAGNGPASTPSNAVVPAAAATVPSSPQAVTAAAGNGQATVTWTAPANNGGSAITGYTVTSTPGGISTMVNGGTLTANVSGLMNGTSYTFTVVATNAVGASAASAPSNAVTPAAPVVQASSGHWVTGYYVGYQRSLYPETSVDFSLMTHIIVGAAEPTSTYGFDTTFFVGNVGGPQMARTLTSRAHAAGRKAILMIGGAGYHDRLDSATAPAHRAAFEANLLAVMATLGFDGVDIDWEPVLTADQPQVMQFIADLRAQQPGIIITFPVGWAVPSFGVSSWYATLAGAVDQLNMMTYDMSYNWSGWVSWHFAALAGEASNHPSSINASVTAYKNAGVPAGKIGVGVGFYGSCWRNVTGPLQAIPSNVSFGSADNVMTYANIMSQYYSTANYHWDATAHQSWLGSTTGMGPQSCNYVSYEDPQSITDKGTYIVNNGIGGAMLWTIGEGHISTAPAGSQDPLMSAAYNAIKP